MTVVLYKRVTQFVTRPCGSTFAVEIPGAYPFDGSAAGSQNQGEENHNLPHQCVVM